MTSQEAKAYVDYLYAKMYERWKEKIQSGPFMTQLRAGKLSLPVIRQFFKNWGRFSLEVNGLNAVSYYTHLPFVVHNFDLLDMHVFEESLTHWSGERLRALTAHYGFTREQAIYFFTHEEADLEPHALGEGGEKATGHGTFNRTVLQCLLEDGKVEFRRANRWNTALSPWSISMRR